MAKDKLTVAVLMGGTSSEREVSIRSGLAVAENLNRKKYNVEVYDTAHDLAKLIKYRDTIDVAFVALHGKGGEDGTIQGFLELLDIPYTFSGIRASANAMDKTATKEIFRQHKLPVASDLILDRKIGYEVDEIMKKIKLPCVVKTVRGGSSLGVYIPQTRLELERAIREARKFDTHILVEKMIQGREFTVATLGNKDKNIEALPVIEIIPKTKWFDYETKYNSDAVDEVCPAHIGQTLTARIQRLAIQAHKALGCRGAARTDILYETKTQKLYLLETNTIPGMTATSLLPKASKAGGYSFPKLLDKLIRLAFENKKPKIKSAEEADKFIMDFSQL